MTGRPSPILDVQGARPLNERLRNFRRSRGLSRAALAAEPGVNSLGARQVCADFPDRAALGGGRRSGHARGVSAVKCLLREALRPIAEPGGATALASLPSDAFIPPPSACVDVRVCSANTNSKEIVS